VRLQAVPQHESTFFNLALVTSQLRILATIMFASRAPLHINMMCWWVQIHYEFSGREGEEVRESLFMAHLTTMLASQTT